MDFIHVIVAYVLGLATAIVFHPLIDAALKRLFRKND